MTSIALTSSTRRAAAIGALGVTMAFAGFGSASAQGVDLRSPDARDASSTPTQTYVDLRSPDAQDSERAAGQGVDLRSPDAKDAGRPAQAPSAQPAAQPSTSSSVGWLVPAIGAGVLALLLVGLMTTLHRRKRPAMAVRG